VRCGRPPVTRPVATLKTLSQVASAARWWRICMAQGLSHHHGLTPTTHPPARPLRGVRLTELAAPGPQTC
jgi:hypothetical protein